MQVKQQKTNKNKQKQTNHCSAVIFGWPSSFLQVTSPTIKAWMSLNFAKIQSLTSELAALQRLKNQ